GYSIKGALPFLNLAIALSLAGLDWTAVEEPKPNPSSLATSPDILNYIGRLADKIHELRAGPESIPSEYKREGDWWVRERTIYYDSHPVEGERGGSYDMSIREHQREELYDCPDCPGLLIIHTRSEVSPPSVHAVLPRQACPHCVQAGAGRTGHSEVR
ncbi:hypothetical protein LJB86_03860, partial [Deltaproteobacteria bacterium OttesenSCG-928-M10]|nr:hypothetical protein [Deltaproteobacteria bacterium OttesenSCG-928-M10]